MKHWRTAAQQAARQAAAQEAERRGCTTLDYRWEHVQAVVATALRLAQQVGADQEIVEAAAWLHDIAKDIPDKGQKEHHGHAGARLARAVLAESDFDPDKIEISVVGDTLKVSGSRTPEDVGEGKYHRRERSCGRFARSFQLPFQVEGDAVEASFERGVLHINLPRAEADKPKRIEVKAK